MTNKLTLTEQEELFAKDCKLINLKYEYNGYTGDEKWAIITELSVKELWEKYPLVIERYSPFVHLSIAQGEVIDDASETLIKKIHTMTSPGQVAKLKRNNYVVNRIKPDNEQIYYIIDAINDSINAGKQISFQYYDYTGLKKKVLKNKGEIYKLSPYKLLWCGDYYYVLGYSEKKSKVINFRVDRIASKPEILDKDIIPIGRMKHQLLRH